MTLTPQDLCALGQVIARETRSRPSKGETVVAINTWQGPSDKISDPIPLKGHNAVQVQVILGSGTGIAADLHIQGSYTTGSFVDLPDPNAVLKGISAPLIIDVPAGCNYLAVKLANLTGSFGANQGWTVIVTPFDSPGARQRTNFYDRNAVTKAYGIYSGVYAPHAATVRLSYTVPSGRMAFLASARASFFRYAAGTGAGYVRNVVQIYAYATGTNTGWAMVEASGDNFVGPANVYQEAVGSGTVLVAGDQVAIVTQDLGTGGTISYSASVVLTECDI